MKKFVLACVMVCAIVMLHGCKIGRATIVPAETKETKAYTKYITSDSTLTFIFVGDSLYIDDFNSGCGIEAYRLEFIASNPNADDVVYDGYEYVLNYDGNTNHLEKHRIRIYDDPLGAHYEYRIEFDNDDPIQLIKVSR